MTVYEYETLLSEAGTPYLAKSAAYSANDRLYISSEEVAEFIVSALHSQYFADEHLHVLCFDAKNHLLGLFDASHGSATCSMVPVREIVQKALLIGAISIAVTHNHPGGDPTPSREDEAATDHLIEACNIVGITLLDHIIVSRAGWCSIANHRNRKTLS